MNRFKQLIKLALVATGIVAFAADARAEYDARIVVDNTYTAEKPYVLETGKTYTAAPLTTVKNACGGAVEVQKGGHLIGTNITFYGNVCGGDYSGYGGAISSIDGTNVFYGTTKFIKNSSSELGGAIHCANGWLTFEGDAVFEENQSEKSSVIAMQKPQVVIFNGNATFTKNTATDGTLFGSNVYGGSDTGMAKIEFNRKATFTGNKGDGLVTIGGSLTSVTFNDEAVFVGNEGRCVRYCTFNAHACFTNNVCTSTSHAACNVDGANQMITFAKGATFSGNTAPRNGAVYNRWHVFFPASWISRRELTYGTTRGSQRNLGIPPSAGT